MTPTGRESALAEVRRDVLAAEAAIAEYKERIKQLESELESLKPLAAYLSRPPLMAPLTASDAAASGHSLPLAENGGTVGNAVTADEIESKAVEMMKRKGPGQITRAIEIATALVADYERDSDKRNFENRVYSVLKRRPELFIRAGKGKWTLKEFGVSGLIGISLEEDELDEPNHGSV